MFRPEGSCLGEAGSFTPTGLVVGGTPVLARPGVKGGHLRTVRRRFSLASVRFSPVSAQVSSLGSQFQSLVDIWVFRKRWSGLQYAEHSCVDCVLHKHVLPVQKGGHVTGVFMRPSVQFSSSR